MAAFILYFFLGHRPGALSGALAVWITVMVVQTVARLRVAYASAEEDNAVATIKPGPF